jgi:hypothetical protein
MIVNNNEDLHRCRLSMRCKYGAHGAVEPGQDAVSPALPMLTDEAVPKKHIGTFEAHLANVRHFFVFCAPKQPAASLFSSPYQSPYLLGAGLHRDVAWIDHLWGTFTSSRTGTSISSQLLDHLIRAKALYLMASIRP